MVSRKRHAFTIVELLVVITIMTMLMAILVPAVMRAMARARTTNCMNNQRQIGQALIGYSTTQSSGAFPGRASFMRYTSGSLQGKPITIADPTVLSSPEPGVTWAMKLLAALDRQDLADELRNPDNGFQLFLPPRDDLKTEKLYMPIFVCPSDVPTAKTNAFLGYVVNSGVPDVKAPNGNNVDLLANGIFHDVRDLSSFPNRISNNRRLAFRPSDIKDGRNNTLMLAENIDATFWTSLHEMDTGFLWNTSGEFNVNVKGASRSDDDYDLTATRFARPSSYHSDGVNVVFADGSHQFLSEEIEYRVYVQLMTPNSSRAAPDPLDPDPTKMPVEFRTPISASDYQ